MDDSLALCQRLWNPEIGPQTYSAVEEKYRAAVMDQYKLYVEMADRISARRGLANTFFLTLNTGVAVAAAAIAKENANISPLVAEFSLAICFGQCVAWWWLVRSYRQLNSAKYKIVAALEDRLPAKLYGDAEWVELGEGKDWRKYLPLSHLEQWVPVGFALIYLIGGVLLAEAM